MTRAYVSQTEDLVVRFWKAGKRHWRITMVGDVPRLEESIEGRWFMAAVSDEAFAMVSVFVIEWVSTKEAQMLRCQAEQRLAIATAEPVQAARWGMNVRSIREEIGKLPEAFWPKRWKGTK